MKNIIKRFLNTYFNVSLDLRVRLFNILALAAALSCLVIAVVNLFAGHGIVSIAVDLVASAFSFGVMWYASRTGRYFVSHLLTVVVVFFGLFPYLFFKMGGYHGGMPAFFVFAMVFTVFMLEGRAALIVTALELTLYVGIYIYAYLNPESVTAFPAEKGFLISNIMDLSIVGVALGATMYAQVRLYRAQQRQLDEQNAVLAETNRAKTQFLANTSHEMRTPLTVISVNTQVVSGFLKRLGESSLDSKAQELLADAQSEIMRLSRMVEAMLKLASLSESAEKRKTDLTAVLRSTADTLRLTLENRRNELETEIEDDLTVFGDADLLSQVTRNLIQNASVHTENDVIHLCAARDGSKITITVSDNGEGIAPELLSRVFERGVSGTDGGTGVGLFLCKTVVESHGGEIWIDSEPGKGTAAHFTLPVYEGQYGGDVI